MVVVRDGRSMNVASRMLVVFCFLTCPLIPQLCSFSENLLNCILDLCSFQNVELYKIHVALHEIAIFVHEKWVNISNFMWFN